MITTTKTTVRFARWAGAAALAVAAWAGPASAAVTCTDTNPVTAGNGGNWSSVASTPGGLYVVSIGNSYSFYDTTVAPYTNNLLTLGFTHSEAANVYWGVGAKYDAATVNPASMGGIGSVDYSQDARKGSLDGVAHALLLVQNGKYYRTAFNVIPPSGNSSMQTLAATGLTAEDFGEFVGQSYKYDTPAADGRANFSSNPDFSATGAPITFGWLGHFQKDADTAADGYGYGTPNATVPQTDLASPGASDSAAAYLLTTSYSITFNEVPEPGTALLAVTALPLLLRRRRGA